MLLSEAHIPTLIKIQEPSSSWALGRESSDCTQSQLSPQADEKSAGSREPGAGRGFGDRREEDRLRGPATQDTAGGHVS